MEALKFADQQVGKLLNSLERKGVLDNALVVMLSDHGEGLSLDHQRWDNSENNTRRSIPAGHGNSVISMAQHLVPLAFRWFGRESFPPGMRLGTASLADVYPTIADLTNMPVIEPIDGQSIAKALLTNSGSVEPRAIPLETGFNTKSSIEGVLEPGRLFQEGAIYYDVLRDGRLQIRPDSVAELISSKQRAILHGDTLFMPAGEDSQGNGLAFIGDILAHDFVIEEIDETQPLVADLRSDFCALFEPDAAYTGNANCATGD